MVPDLVPTEYARKMRFVFIALLVVIAALVIGKFVISDYWSGISLIFVVIMGALCVTGEYGINAINCLFFAVMSIICAIFDVIACVMYFQHSKYGLFQKDAPTMVLVAQGVFVLTPIVQVIAGLVAYSIYADCRDNSPEVSPFGGSMEADYGVQPSPPPR